MKKRLAALFMAISMGATLLTGCGGASSQNETSPQTDSSAAESQSSTDAYNVVISYVTLGSDPVDLKMVQDAMSDYTMEKFGCTVTLKSVPISNMTSEYNLWASSGEDIDLLCLFMQNIGTMVDEGKIIPLDDYMTEENTPNLLSIADSNPFLSGGLYNGIQYGIPVVNPSQGEGKAMYAVGSYLDSVDYESKDIYTYEDMLSVFAKIKEQYPDITPWAQLGTLSSTMSTNFINCDQLGVSGGIAGVLMDVGNGSTDVVNLFETPEYYAFLQFMQQCYKNGYISSDAATSTDAGDDWVKSGRSAGFTIGDDTPGNVENRCASWSVDDVRQFNLKETYVTTSTYSAITWGVSSNSKNPAKALQVLDELYAKDATLLNMIMNGLEGVHYIAREGSKIIDYPEGMDGTNTTYNNILGLYGDKRNMSMFSPNEDSFYTRSEEYTSNALKNQSAALGYTFVSEDYTNQIAQITSVLNQYLSSLEYGMVDDLDGYYQDFLGALKDAGIDEVVAANQEQLDAFLAAR
ncbi:MAG: ABC transporter substrate-binding protein [Lachnospiraceae bacterium]|nr:ABC transporter substrate-binding protein [Lachnospiraceae bacterium]